MSSFNSATGNAEAGMQVDGDVGVGHLVISSGSTAPGTGSSTADGQEGAANVASGDDVTAVQAQNLRPGPRANQEI